MTLSSVLLVLLQVCSLQLMVAAMPKCQLQGDLVMSTHHLLRDLGEEFPVHCRVLNTNISFPDSAFPAKTTNHPQCRQALWVVYESLREAGQIFGDHELPVGEGGVTWDNAKLEDFQNLQFRLLEEGSCLSRVSGSGVLSSYFSNVTAVLQQQESAACGWMALRRDLLRVLATGLQKHCTCFTWRDGHKCRDHAQ
ncbi:interferon phi 3 [Siniperca chuatsi]|uniref:Type I interferon c n=1 Tax=Siniperca chuatsi TaxID=119488 RepID=A0A3Q8E9K1_SINCH|nr:interferon phi 3 [Siniperca chuatsi]XP_044037314.1 interferon phi 3 [Siniperca chuatsi]AVJ47959.1 type I interferon c [Siniperca chuatsi]AVJ47966.1 type I interferon c [Siniperca chuatsi]